MAQSYLMFSWLFVCLLPSCPFGTSAKSLCAGHRPQARSGLKCSGKERKWGGW
jgi:hypothetical protein